MIIRWSQPRRVRFHASAVGLILLITVSFTLQDGTVSEPEPENLDEYGPDPLGASLGLGYGSPDDPYGSPYIVPYRERLHSDDEESNKETREAPDYNAYQNYITALACEDKFRENSHCGVIQWCRECI